MEKYHVKVNWLARWYHIFSTRLHRCFRFRRRSPHVLRPLQVKSYSRVRSEAISRTPQPAERRRSIIRLVEVTTVVPTSFVTRSKVAKHPDRLSRPIRRPQRCHLIGTPSLTGAGLTLSSFSSFAGLSPCSSTLVSRCRKLLSFTGLPLCPACSCPPFVLLLPLLPLGPGEVRCGMFSGRGC